jgi:hypothetical protein
MEKTSDDFVQNILKKFRCVHGDDEEVAAPNLQNQTTTPPVSPSTVSIALVTTQQPVPDASNNSVSEICDKIAKFSRLWKNFAFSCNLDVTFGVDCIFFISGFTVREALSSIEKLQIF